MLLRKLLTDYQTERPDLLASSARQILYSIHSLENHLGRVALVADLNKAVFLAWMLWAKEKMASRSVNHHRTNLLALWRYASELNLIVPPPTIKKLKEPLHIPVCWTLAEIRTLYRATDLIEGNWEGVPIRLCWKICIATLWDTATRIGTFTKAALSEVNLTAGTWIAPAEHIKGGGSDKVYRLHPATIALIRYSLTTPRQMIFPFPHRQREIYKHYGRLLALAGLPADRKHHFHCIRRTSESFAAQKAGIELTAEIVGHSAQVARKHYVSPVICKPPALIDYLPRPF